jgi:hypothetical protein
VKAIFVPSQSVSKCTEAKGSVRAAVSRATNEAGPGSARRFGLPACLHFGSPPYRDRVQPGLDQAEAAGFKFASEIRGACCESMLSVS